MMEAGVLLRVYDGNPIYWHTPNDRSGGALPDSRSLWDVIWENRAQISGFAHTHPGYGVPGPSYTDLTTFAAIEEALGRRLEWWIASGDKLVLCFWQKAEARYGISQIDPVPATLDAVWLAELRRLSGFPI